jgi:hypothetical protein
MRQPIQVDVLDWKHFERRKNQLWLRDDMGKMIEVINKIEGG